jgi:hypothetical protein
LNPEKQEVFVVGDMGKACIFDVSFELKNSNKMLEAMKLKIVGKAGKKIAFTDGVQKDYKWRQVVPWF